MPNFAKIRERLEIPEDGFPEFKLSETVLTENSDLDYFFRKFSKSKISLEAYTGKLPIVKDTIKICEQIRAKMLPFVGKTLNSATSKECVKLIAKMQENLAKHFNVESVQIVVSPSTSFACYPTQIGKIDDKHLKPNSTKINSSEFCAVISDSNGIRYKYKDNKHICILIGHVFFTNPKSSGEIAASLIFFGCGSAIINAVLEVPFGVQWVWKLAEKLMPIINLVRWVPKMLPGSLINTLIYTYIVLKSVIGKIWGFASQNINKFTSVKEEFDDNFYENIVLQKDFNTATKITIIHFEIVFQWFLGLAFSGGQKILSSLFMHPMDAIPMLRPSEILESKAGKNLISQYGLSVEFTKAIITLDDIGGDKAAESSGIGIILQVPLLWNKFMRSIMTGNMMPVANIMTIKARLVTELNNLKKNNGSKILIRRIEEEIDNIDKVLEDHTDMRKAMTERLYGRAAIYGLLNIFKFFKTTKPLKNDSDKVAAIREYPKYSPMFAHMLGITSDTPDIIDEELKNNIIESSITDKLSFSKIIDENADISNFVESYRGGVPIDYVFEEKQWIEPEISHKINANFEIAFEKYYADTVIGTEVVEFVTNLRNVLMNKKDKERLNSSEVDKCIKYINKFENIVCKEFNVESTCISLDGQFNACAIMMFAGSKDDNEAFERAKIVESANGFKFDKPDGLRMLFVMGIPIITSSLSVRAVAAVMMHEFGHCFQTYECESFAAYKARNTYNSIYNSLKNLITSVAILSPVHILLEIFYFIPMAFISKGNTRFKWSRKDADTEYRSFARKVLELIKIDKNGKFLGFGRNKKDRNGDTKNAININSTNNNALVGEENFPLFSLMTLWKSIGFVLYETMKLLPIPGVASLGMQLARNPYAIFDYVFLWWSKQRDKQCEYFADTFATKYGFGADLADFLDMLSQRYADYGKNRSILIRGVIQVNYLIYIKLMLALDDHPTDDARIRNIHEKLLAELKDAKLDPRAKKQIEDAIHNIEKQWAETHDFNKNMKNGRIGFAIICAFTKGLRKIRKNAQNIIEYYSNKLDDSGEELKTAVADVIKNDDYLSSTLGIPNDIIDRLLDIGNLEDEEAIADYLLN